jgi:galactokinase/mevalonate kinase-like predicted kinase
MKPEDSKDLRTARVIPNDQSANENWHQQKRLHASVTNETIDAIFALAMKSGASAGKACGAGGRRRARLLRVVRRRRDRAAPRRQGGTAHRHRRLL